MADISYNTELSCRQILSTSNKIILVDNEDYEHLSKHKWSHSCYRYAQRYVSKINGKTLKIKMHREIMNAKHGQIVDHINGNFLDNRRSNLRFCTTSQNHANRRVFCGNSKFKGVHFVKGKNYFQVTCKKKYVGIFKNEIDAAKAYNEAAKTSFGEFAYLNDVN